MSRETHHVRYWRGGPAGRRPAPGSVPPAGSGVTILHPPAFSIQVISPDSTAVHGFDGLYARLYPSLHRYVARLVGDGDAAEDVVQETFLRLLRRGDLTGEDARLWVFAVATNLVRDRGRAQSRRQRLLAAEPVHQPMSPQPDAVLERSESIHRVRAALDQLPERDRVMLMMREEGFRYAEIAEVLNVATSSVGTLIARAIKRFVEVYSPDE